MSEEPKKPCWAYRASVVFVMLLFGYRASLVPLQLASITGPFPQWFTDVLRAAYSPLGTSVFAITFAAFCVWLGVRIVNRRERWAKWTAGVIGYPLSIGPVVWLLYRKMLPEWAPHVVGVLYYPLQIIFCSTARGGEIYACYVTLWTP
jgi:hypothetical protein